MKKEFINKLITLGFLESKDVLSVYGQEIVDKFLSLLLLKLKKDKFKHYNNYFIKNDIYGRYYRIINNTLELAISEDNVNNDALDLQYLFSKSIKDILGISLIEGSKVVNNYKYYFGYVFNSSLYQMYVIKQNKSKTYLRFNLLNIFYSIINEEDYLSYLITPYITIIPLHQTKSGVLSYASKIKDKINFNAWIDDRAVSTNNKSLLVTNKRCPLTIYVGPKEVKNNKLIIEYNKIRECIDFDKLNNIDYYLEKSFKDKLNKSLKNNFIIDKELTKLENLKKVNKVNICENCKINNYSYFLTPFNRISKTNKCLVCDKEVNNVIFIKK